MAGCRLVTISADGEVRGCPSHPKSFGVGSVRKEPFAEIWQEAERFSYNTQWDESSLRGACAECAYSRICRAGCTSMAYAITATIYDNPFCAQRADAGKASP